MGHGKFTDDLRKIKGDLKTQSGYDVKEVYVPDDIANLDFEGDIGMPGTFPFVRGTYPRMYREKLWVRGATPGSVRYAQDEGKTEEEAMEEMLEKAIVTTGLRSSGDCHQLATVDPDHPLVGPDIGNCGGPLFAAWQYLHGKLGWYAKLMARSTQGFVLELGNACGPADVCQFTMMIATMETLGMDITKLRGNMVNDPLHVHIIRSMSYKQPLEVGFRVSTDAMEWCVKNTPLFRPTNGGCAYNMRESGINTIQELAFRFGNYIEYTDEMVRRGISFESWGHRPAIALSGEIDFFETICKLRAARRIYARLATERYGADPKTLRCPPCNTNLAGDSMTLQQPIFNVIRNTIEAIASVLGGVNGMELKHYTEAISPPSPEAVTVSSAIEAIIADEANIPLVADPLGGSYYVEWLTTRIESDVMAYLQKILDMGGMREVIKTGWLQEEVEKAAQERQRELEERQKIKVGLNAYQSLLDWPIKLPMLRRESGNPYEPWGPTQKSDWEEWETFKRNRDLSQIKPALEHLYQVAKSDKNLIRAMVEAWKANASIGEVMGVIRAGMGFSYDQFEMVPVPEFLELSWR
ncbi:MAG: hypothetical protein FJ006_09355 [Chloroflexi bacterium]|nr:hypothetical protein [Chloroflexota bacterium]